MRNETRFTLESLKDLVIEPTEVEVEDKETGEVKTFRTVNRAEVATIMAYLIGINNEKLDEFYGAHYETLLETLRNDNEATIVRFLCRARTCMLSNFLNIDNKIRYELSNIDRMDYFHTEEINQLMKWGVPIVRSNCRADEYSLHFCDLIDKHIDNLKHLFPEYVRFDYIRECFVAPKYRKHGFMASEYNKFKGHKGMYPFQNYLYWEPEDNGYLLYSDFKFLSTIYKQHKDEFTDPSRVRDAVEDTKKSIYDFLRESENVVMVVDCENSDAYKIYGMLKSLKPQEVSRIKKILLYDDYHTTTAWDYLGKIIHIPVEHYEIDRVVEGKSLVDLEMTVGVCRAFFKDEIDSFVLCSSDSDFWGLIKPMPEARFLVMYEYSKCGSAIREHLAKRDIFHCALDDFYQGNAGDLKNIVLRNILKHHLPDLLGENGWELTKRIFGEAYIEASESDMKTFYEKYVKTLRLRMDDKGVFFIDVTD